MEEQLFFKNSKGDKLSAILSTPTDDKTKTLVIMVHGFTSNKNTENFVKLTEFLNEKDISSFRFDIYGHGESEGKFEDITITEAVDDILKTINFLKLKGYSKLGLIGSSFGGISSIMTASKTDDLSFLILKSPVSNYEEVEEIRIEYPRMEEWKKNGFKDYENNGKKMRLNYTFYEDFKNNNGYEAAPKIKIPTLIVHGDADQIVPVEQSLKTSKLIPNCELVIIKGANHRYTEADHTEQMRKAIEDFILKHISK